MIVFLATKAGLSSFTDLLPNFLRPVRRRIQALTYGQLAGLGELPAATYIFSDFERMNSVQIELAQQAFEQIRNHGPELILLNEPARYKPRFAFMRDLYERGINPFNVYRVHEIGPHVRYPVFVRLENDHTGPRTDLLTNESDLRLALLQATLGAVPFQDLMVVEFVDTRRPDGYYEVYAASKFGCDLKPRHKNTHHHWIVKGPNRGRGDRWDPWQVQEDRDYQTGQVHEGIAEAFELAGIEWGRADYAIIDGKPVIYEINSNPVTVPQPDKYLLERQDSQDHMVRITLDALEQLDSHSPPHPGIQLEFWLRDRQPA